MRAVIILLVTVMVVVGVFVVVLNDGDTPPKTPDTNTADQKALGGRFENSPPKTY